MNKQNDKAELGFMGVLTLILVVLKLVGIVSWSWWIVASPILIEVGVQMLFCLIVLIFSSGGKRK